jgi:plastocyanin
MATLESPLYPKLPAATLAHALLFLAGFAVSAGGCGGPEAPPPPAPEPPPAPAGSSAGFVPVPAALSEGSGTLAGRVVYRGPLPATTKMYVPEAGEIDAHTIVADAESRGLKDAVVWVEGGPSPAKAPAASLEPAVMDQRSFGFTPHVLAVRAGQTVRFLNSDAANHNVHSFAAGNEFNLGTPTGGSAAHRFRKPTRGVPVKIGCDIHDWMLAWVHVFEDEPFAVTGAAGRFRLEGVPAGKHRLRVLHDDGKLAAESEVVVVAGETRELEIEAVPAAR